MALKSDGTVVAWGDNIYSQLGDGTTTSRSSPAAVPGLTGVVALAAADFQTVALKSDGTVMAWGMATTGPYGDGAIIQRASPELVSGLCDVVALAVGSSHIVALRSDGTVVTWGANNYSGLLGNGTFAQQQTAAYAINETLDGVLDLLPDLPNLPDIIAPPFFSVALLEGASIISTSTTVTNTIKFNATDIGKSGSVYVTTWAPANGLGKLGISTAALNHAMSVTVTNDNPYLGDRVRTRQEALSTALASSDPDTFVLVQLTSSGWQLVENGQLIPYASGVLGDQLATQTILNATDTTNLKGAEFCLGYGTSAEEMASAGRMRTVATIPPDPGSATTTTGSCIIQASAIDTGGGVNTPVNVIEFYNANLDHYFITADSNEAAQIDNGSAGPGWSRTGNSFKSGGSTSVCRFYGSQSPGPNSHFYTADQAECQWLKDQHIPTGDPRKLTDKSWNFESMDFVSTMPANGICPTDTTPIYRAYNNGYARGVDSNHRIINSLSAINEVVARGWNNEGVVMCAPE